MQEVDVMSLKDGDQNKVHKFKIKAEHLDELRPCCNLLIEQALRRIRDGRGAGGISKTLQPLRALQCHLRAIYNFHA